MKKKVDHIYFIRVGDPSENLYKIGTTNNLKRRMREHEKNDQKQIEGFMGVARLFKMDNIKSWNRNDWAMETDGGIWVYKKW